MSNQGNFTGNHRRSLAFVAAPLALLLALVAALGLGSSMPAFAQPDQISVVAPSDAFVPAGDYVEGVQGGSVTFHFVVNNNTGVALNNFTIQNACNGGVTPSLTVLPPGATTFTCVINGLTQTFPTTIAVSGRRTDNNALVSASDSTEVRVLYTGIHVTKVANPDHVVKGGNVTFDITVRNTGGGSFKAQPAPTAADGSFIKVQDLQCDPLPANALDAPVALLVDNGTPGVLDPDPAPVSGRINGDVFVYRCTTTNPLFSFTNQANVTARNNSGQTFDRMAFADVVVLSPGLAITKEPKKAIVNVNTPVDWIIKIYNTGQTTYSAFGNPTDTPLTPGDPTCTLSGAIDKGVEFGNPAAPNDLNPGEVWTYTCSLPGGYATAGAHQNRADTPAGVAPAASAIGSVQVVNPGLLVEKTPPFQYVVKGQNANFIIKVTNTTLGGGSISNVQVLDPLCTVPPVFTGGDTNNDGKLTADNPATPLVNEAETWLYACTILNVQADTTNAVSVKGTGPAGDALLANATAFVKVINNGLNIAKGGVSSTGNNPIVLPTAPKTTVIEADYGANVRFDLWVTNQGNVPLSNISVSDPFCDATAPNALAAVPQGAPNQAFNIGDIDRDNQLDPGENWQYVCTRSKVIQDILNTASVTGRDPLNNLVSADTSRQVNVLNPNLVLEKTPAFQAVQAGQDVKWTLRVRNTGKATLFPDRAFGVLTPDMGIEDFGFCNFSNIDYNSTAAGVQSVPPHTGSYTDANGTTFNNVPDLRAGESWSFDCTTPASFFGLNGYDQYLNTAVARFIDGNKNKVTDFESAEVQIFGSTIDIEKSAASKIVAQGQSLDFTLQVRNLKPTVVLSNIQVSDVMCSAAPVLQPGGDTNGDGKLQAGEVWTYKCTVPGQTKDYVNTASVTATDSNGNTVKDNDDFAVQVINAKLSVIKTTTTPVVGQGSNVDFTIKVKNTGAIRLINPTLSDAMCQGGKPTFVGSDFNNDNALSPNETWTYSCQVTNVQNDFTNTATAQATEESTNIVVNSSGSADVTVSRPGINLTKTATNPNVLAGQNASFVLTVGNTGNTDLTAVNLVDPQCNVGPTRTGGDTNNDNKLNPGEIWSYSCVVNNVQRDFVNSAVVTAAGPNGAVAASASASVSVINPSINLEKTPVQQTVNAGGTANFTILVSNRGNAALSNVVVSDAQCNVGPTRTSGDTNNNNQLDTNEVWSYSCAVNNVLANFTNTASVTATGPNGSSVSASDTADVTVLVPSIKLTKTPKTQTVNQGGSANFTLLVQNTGNTTLNGVQVTDALCSSVPALIGGDVNSNGQLDTSETWVYTCATNNVQASFVNTASATANGIATPATDTANVTVNATPAPRIALSKTPKAQTIAQGGTANFTLIVTNPGNTALGGVKVTDALCSAAPAFAGGDANGNGQLDTTETWVYTCASTNVQASFVNTAVASATGAGQAVNASDTANVTIQPTAACGIDVVISPHTATVAKGSTVPFVTTVKALNCTAPLTKVTLKVDKCNVKPGAPTGDVNNNGQLDPTETWTYTCSATNVKSNFTNTASVSATAPNGKSVKDTDKAVITVTKTGVKSASVDSADDSDNTDTWDLSNDEDTSEMNNNLYLPAIANQ